MTGCPREIENWDADGGLRRQPLRLDRPLVRRERQGRSSPRSTTSSAARRSSTAPRCTGCGSATSASSSTTAGSHRPGRSTTASLEPYYTQAEELYQVHGARGEDPTEPPASAPYPYPPVSHEPRIQRLFDDLTQVGLHPFHSPSGHHARRGGARLQPVHPLRHLRRLPVPGARQVRRRGDRRTTGAASTTTSTSSATPSYAGSRPTRPVAR